MGCPPGRVSPSPQKSLTDSVDPLQYSRRDPEHREIENRKLIDALVYTVTGEDKSVKCYVSKSVPSTVDV
ncbi:hypothetical protein QJS04_geneDACA004292 [Acorus gramineus]|uniref:Uncharacterized protein n=1 Tax=Acorus gramineus TaxID=55184 RepID=A0AAV9B574_ACOGR|nr:hypothetical protein QJS04_geneDACA004292 [Acorus gramineus]